jgi:hypothetical protein
VFLLCHWSSVIRLHGGPRPALRPRTSSPIDGR